MSKVNRRELLTRAWKWGFGLVSVAFAWTTWDMFKPSNAAGFGENVSAGPADSVPTDNVVEVPAMRGYLTTDKGETVALWWKCPHLGCRVPWCDSSGQFECPCHGSVFNRVGEWREGPAPRGLDRFSMEIVDGVVEVDTGSVIAGPPHGTETIDEPPRGPRCQGTEDA